MGYSFSQAMADIAKAKARQAAENQAIAQPAKPGTSDLAKTLALVLGANALGPELAKGLREASGAAENQSVFSGLYNQGKNIFSDIKDSLFGDSKASSFGGLGKDVTNIGPVADGGEYAAMLGEGGPGLGALALGAHGAYSLANNFGEGDWQSGAISGAELIPALYPFLGPFAFAAPLVGGLSGLAKTGKTNEDTIQRDSIRNELVRQGFGPEEDLIRTRGGDLYDIGNEGGGQGAYNTPDNPFKEAAIGYVNPLAELSQGYRGDKARSDTAGFLSSSALHGGQTEEDVRQNARFFYDQAGITREEAFDGIQKLFDQNMISNDEFKAYQNALSQVFR